jgi:tetratricopeptide (TPR) repeat protein
MKLEFAPQEKSLFAATALALLAMFGTAWAAAPPATLTPEQAKAMLDEGEGVLKGGNPDLAISKYFEPVNMSFMRATASAGADDEVYASHGTAETAAYTAKIAKKNEGAKTQTKLVIVDGAWTDSLLMKARAQVQMQKEKQAISTLDMATTISPFYPPVWMELGDVYSGEKNWDKALEMYKNAENLAGALDDKERQKQTMCESLRGQGAVLTELKQLDAAAEAYKRCFKYVPKDPGATEGLQKVADAGGPPVPAAPAPAPAAPPPKSR